MKPPVEFQLDREVNALYVGLGSGKVARTIALADSVSADVDADGAPIGLEFVNAGELVPFLCNHVDAIDMPPEMRNLFRVSGA